MCLVAEPGPIMVATSPMLWRTLERWHARAFFAAGVLWLADATLLGLEILRIYAHGLLNGFFVAAAMLATVIGLLGFVPSIGADRPRLARFNAVLGAVAAVAMGATVVWQLAAITRLGSGSPPGVTAVPTLLALGWFGLTVFWLDAPTRTAGALLLALATPWLGLVAVALLGPPAWVQSPAPWHVAVLVSLFAVLSIAVGYVVRTERGPLELEEPSAEDSVA